jgi:FkbM family methyltransferase
MPVTSLVNYPGKPGLFYRTLNTHAEHAPTKITRNGKIWERKLYDQYKEILKPDDIAIDVGGYIGTHSLPMSRLCWAVYVFEPNTELFQVIVDNIALNQIDNVIPNNVAIGLPDNSVDFYEREDGTSRIATRPIKGNKKEIKTYSLDDYMDLTNVPSCKLIKIDVEGHEYEVLEGAKNLIEKYKPYILIETFKSKRPRLNEWCEVNNYHSTWLRGDDFLLSPQ